MSNAKLKKILDYTEEELALCVEILKAAALTTGRQFLASVEKLGVTDRATLNAHDWTEHLVNAATFIEKMRKIQAGEPLPVTGKGLRG